METIASLAADSGLVFIGTARPLSQDSSTGETIATFTVNQVLAGDWPRTEPYPEISEGQAGDVPVTVGQQYLVFQGVDLSQSDIQRCVVGGARGLFDYDSATQIATRTSTTPSQIPTTIPLAQVIAQLPDPNVAVPTPEPPLPICSSSVTGS